MKQICFDFGKPPKEKKKIFREKLFKKEHLTDIGLDDVKEKYRIFNSRTGEFWKFDAFNRRQAIAMYYQKVKNFQDGILVFKDKLYEGPYKF